MEKDFIGNNLPSEKDKHRVNRVGIAQCINDRVVFTHRTFAEYFVAGFLADKLSRGKDSKKYETIIEFLAKELFENKNEVIKTFLDYRLAKHAAILKKGKLDIIRKNVSVTDALGRSVVHYAAQEGHKEIVDALINNGVDIKKPDELGKTALHYAARYNHGTEVVSCLLENAKDCINSKDKNGRTAVYYAAQQGYTKSSRKEKKEGEKEIDVIAIKDNHDNTLLHIAARKGHFTVVEFLLGEGAGVSVANNSGKVPISYAAEGCTKSNNSSPTYFAPKYLEVSQEKRVLVDGGVFANNPAACAYANSKKLFPNEEIVLVSIGTGRLSNRMKYRKLGKIAWIKPLLNVMFASSLDVVNYQLGNVMDDRYVRIQSQLTIASAEMDNVTPKNIKCLQQEANAMIEGNQKVIDKFCDIVS
ncbi:patatin-like phospholipase [Trichonephila clavata]|uniref:Patatin-like phospholipase n=1 Tax=Trichonephila clavata TaxID=2740835 RepID=A0A8X6L4M9_TRICU|nr:patatin-like phospholipase [Trichonephila clavata]